jgi:hypothetical protein
VLKLDFLPQATQQLFHRLKEDPRLGSFTLVGGSALALHIGHRMSEDLDFNCFGYDLPCFKLDALLAELSDSGCEIRSLIPAEKKVSFKINTGQDLDRHIQDYAIDGVKVTFHARQAPERPRAQIEFLIASTKHELTPSGFSVMGLDGLFVMKTLVVYDRVKSRDLYDLMVLTRDHGYTLKDAFAAIAAYQPARHQDPEHFKSVLTGLVPLNKDDEGFSSIQLHIKMKDIYQYFKKLLNAYEVQAVSDILQSKHKLK